MDIKSFTTVFLPAKTESKKLLIVLHGLGDSVEGFRFLPEYLQLPKLNYLLVNAPDSYFTGYSWYDIFGKPEAGILRSRQKLFRLLGELEKHGFAAKDIAVFGFSQGCLMAVDLACRYTETLAGVIGVSGYVGFLEEYPEKFSPVARTQKILITHGSEDPLLPLAKSREQFLALKGMGLQLDWYEYEKAHTIDEKDEIGDIKRFLVKALALGQ